MARLMLRPGAIPNSPLDFLEKRALSATVPFTPLIILPLAAHRGVAFCQVKADLPSSACPWEHAPLERHEASYESATNRSKLDAGTSNNTA
jgi:hypothetical protein